MQRIAKGLLFLFAFTVPWEYSLDLGEPWGNVARVAGLILVLAAIPAALARRWIRKPDTVQWLTLALFLWLCCTAFWTLDIQATLERLRGDAQEMMIVWLVWEFCEDERDLRSLLGAALAGSWVLVLLTIADALSTHGVDAGQIRFAPIGQDPNDVARFLDFGFPMAAWMLTRDGRWLSRLLAFGYFPAGLGAVLLTASRGGFLAAVVALTGSGVLLLRNHFRAMVWGGLALPLMAGAIWFAIPHPTLERLATIPDQLQGGDLNQRLNIWDAGWRGFLQTPMLGHGAGTFVTAAGLATGDTAHNTILSLLVEGGLVSFALALAIFVVLMREALQTEGSLRLALFTILAVWAVASLVGTLIESRMTWLLFGMMSVARRIAMETEAEKRTPVDSAHEVPVSSLRSHWKAMPDGSVTP
ncbi:MAG: O-antigen ligase family protein [Terracidiphilus sp.]